MTLHWLAVQFLFYLALATALLWLGLAIAMIIGNRRLHFLKEMPPLAGAEMPVVSIIIPACNEERNLAEALQSVLHQDYPRLEIIVINDRSTDATGDILNRLALTYPQLRVHHINELPAAWLGKNHALQVGAAQASGDLLLFTDADIVMQPSVISRAVHYLQTEKLDHLTISMEIRMRGALLGMFTLAFGVFFSMYSRYWRARKPRSRAHVGIGGFNMVRAAVYRSIGGHTKIAMRPDDDMKLGKLIKAAGYRQQFMFGVGMMHVEWYASLSEALRGLEKNSFAGVDYSVLKLIGSTVALFALNVMPFVAVFFTHGATQIVNAAISLFILLFCAYGAGFHNIKRWYAVGFPLVTLLFIFILWRSALIALRNGGINWRGTHYSLAELKANRL